MQGQTEQKSGFTCILLSVIEVLSQLLHRQGKKEKGDELVSYSPLLRVFCDMLSRHSNPKEGSLRVPWGRKVVRMRVQHGIQMSVTHLLMLSWTLVEFHERSNTMGPWQHWNLSIELVPYNTVLISRDFISVLTFLWTSLPACRAVFGVTEPLHIFIGCAASERLN